MVETAGVLEALHLICISQSLGHLFLHFGNQSLITLLGHSAFHLYSQSFNWLFCQSLTYLY